MLHERTLNSLTSSLAACFTVIGGNSAGVLNNPRSTSRPAQLSEGVEGLLRLGVRVSRLAG